MLDYEQANQSSVSDLLAKTIEALSRLDYKTLEQVSDEVHWDFRPREQLREATRRRRTLELLIGLTEQRMRLLRRLENDQERLRY